MNDLIPFDFDGEQVRAVVGQGGAAEFVLADICRVLGLTSPTRVAERLDPDDLSTAQVIDSLGRTQTATTVTESGVIDVTLDSRKPEARRFRRWLTHEVVPQIAQTGTYSTAPVLTDDQIVHQALQITNRRVDELTAQVASLTPSASAWNNLVETTGGDWDMRDSAHMLSRDPAISIGRNRLAKYLREIGWCDRKGIPYQKHVDIGRLDGKPQWRTSHRTGERMACDPQVRITVKGLGELHRLLGGTEPLDTTPPTLTAVPA